MKAHMISILAVLAILLGPIWGMSAGARAGDAEQLVIQYLDNLGARSYTIIPITDDYVVDTFPNVALFGVFFRQYPQPILPPKGLAYSNVFYVQDSQVAYLTDPSELEDFFVNELAPVQDAKAARDAGRSWLRISEDFSQDLFFHFYKPAVTVQDNVVSGAVQVKSGGSGQIQVIMTFDNSGQLVDVQETREVVKGIRPY